MNPDHDTQTNEAPAMADDQAAHLRTLMEGAAATDPQPEAATEVVEPAVPPEMLAAIAKLPAALLRAIRARIAKKLPEINDEWTDGDLQTVADAVPPVVMKHAARLAPLMGQYPEEGMLLISLIPLGMGYLAASSAAEERQAKQQALPLAREGAQVLEVRPEPEAAQGKGVTIGPVVPA